MTMPDPMPTTLGRVLNDRLDVNGHTQRDAAAVIGTSGGTLNKWVNDSTTPSAEFFHPLCDYLDVDIDTLGGLILRAQLERADLRLGRALGNGSRA